MNAPLSFFSPILYLRPRTICAGIGCKRNMEQKPIEEALLQTLKEEGLHPLSLKCIATIPLKSDELGIIGTAANLNVPLKIIPTEKIEKLDISNSASQLLNLLPARRGCYLFLQPALIWHLAREKFFGIRQNIRELPLLFRKKNPELRSKGDASKESRYPIFVTLVAAG